MTAPRTALVTPTRRKPSRHPYTSPPQAPRWNTCRQRGPGRVPAGPCARQPGQAERACARAGSEHLGGDERRYCSSDALRWVSASVCYPRDCDENRQDAAVGTVKQLARTHNLPQARPESEEAKGSAAAGAWNGVGED